MKKVFVVTAVVLGILIFVNAGFASEIEVSRDNRLSFRAEDGSFLLEAGLLGQMRYRFDRPEDDNNRSSFSVNLLEPVISGHIYDPSLRYMFLSEFGAGEDNPRLLAGWAEYDWRENHTIRAGQYPIPFGWERDVSSMRLLFTSRSLAHSKFSWPGDYDIGVMQYGDLNSDLSYAIGMFGAEGINISSTETDGHLYSARLRWSAKGDYPNQQFITEPVDGMNLGFGLGGYYANETTHFDESDTSDVRTATLDFNIQSGNWVGHLSGFTQRLTSDADTDTRGRGYVAQAGYLLQPERLFLGARFSAVRPEHNSRTDRERQYGAALHYFHRGAASRFILDLSRTEEYDDDDWVEEDLVALQYQFEL